MHFEDVKQFLHVLTKDELFYQNYRKEKENPETFDDYIKSLDIKDIRKHRYIIPEIKETIPIDLNFEYEFADTSFGINIQKHDCFCPEYLHSHQFFELSYVYEGTCRQTIFSQTFNLTKGDTLIIPPSISHSIDVDDESIIINIMISKEELLNIFRNPSIAKHNKFSEVFVNYLYTDNKDAFIVHNGNDEEIAELMLKLYYENYNKYDGYELMLISYMTAFSARIERMHHNKIQLIKNQETGTSKINDMLTCIRDNYSTISLQEIASKFYFSKEHCSRLIKEKTGYNFKDLVNRYRMEQAANLLTSTNMQISYISKTVGFNNIENFNRAFKTYYKSTPKEYRINNTNFIK